MHSYQYPCPVGFSRKNNRSRSRAYLNLSLNRVTALERVWNRSKPPHPIPVTALSTSLAYPTWLRELYTPEDRHDGCGIKITSTTPRASRVIFITPVYVNPTRSSIACITQIPFADDIQ